MQTGQKKVIIVGATSGIGRELACMYLVNGHTVGVTGRRERLLNQLKLAYPEQVHISCFDVTGEGNQFILDELIATMGGLDLLIYNAGFGDPSAELKWEIENATTRTNVNGFVEVINHAFNYFLKKGSGQIALTSSVAAVRGNSWTPAYSASKAYMSNYAEGLNIKAKRLRKAIVVTDIRPGFVNTKMSKGAGQFWVAPVSKAARQMISAIERKKRVSYVTKRWWLVAQIMKLLPFSIYRRIA